MRRYRLVYWVEDPEAPNREITMTNTEMAFELARALREAGYRTELWVNEDKLVDLDEVSRGSCFSGGTDRLISLLDRSDGRGEDYGTGKDET